MGIIQARKDRRGKTWFSLFVNSRFFGESTDRADVIFWANRIGLEVAS